MDINDLRQHTADRLRNATPLGTFDDHVDAEALALRSQPALITGGVDGYTVWRLQTGLRWDRILPAVENYIACQLDTGTQAMVDQHQASMRTGLASYGLELDEHTVFVLIASNLAMVGQTAHALVRGILPFPAAASVMAILRGNLAALLDCVPEEARR